ncbi:MAG: phosphomannose isomerase type II C-terminal cupin domain [Geminicoccaceae bacterium]|nr:phosphomannose isomerase type II C-terminal cupin domain [Geminicoccaceae bacterium]
MAEVRYARGESDERPWGRWEVVDTGEAFTVKRITVKPGQKLSLQLHHHREEHWVIVKGNPLVTVGDEARPMRPNEHVFIPLGAKHRIENPTDETVEFVEVQYGERLDENDIVRLEDSYGRG